MEALAARGVATILGLVATLQLALALGAPLGAHVYGGRAAGAGEALPPAYRVVSLVTVGVLVAAGWLVLSRAGLVSPPAADSTFAVRGTWALVVLFVVNTVANLASVSALERWGLGAATALAAVLTLIVARS